MLPTYIVSEVEWLSHCLLVQPRVDLPLVVLAVGPVGGPGGLEGPVGQGQGGQAGQGQGQEGPHRAAGGHWGQWPGRWPGGLILRRVLQGAGARGTASPDRSQFSIGFQGTIN